MAKLTNVRERVHQPFRDTLIRTSGIYASSVQDRTELFTQAGKSDGDSNLKNGSTLPSDQSMVVLALRVFTWFRNSVLRDIANCGEVGPRYLAENGDVGPQLDGSTPEPCAPGGLGSKLNGSAFGDYHDVYRLHWQAEEQLLWSFGSGQKFSLTSMPTAYFPYGGGIYGDMGHAGTNCCQVIFSGKAPSDGGLVLGGGSAFSPLVVGGGAEPKPVPTVTPLRTPCCNGQYVVSWGLREEGAYATVAVLQDKEQVILFEGYVPAFPSTIIVNGLDGAPCFSVGFPPAEKAFAAFSILGNPAGCSPLIHWENGTPDHSGILRLARAILLPPRQNVLCQAQIVRLPDGGNSGIFGATQGARNMLSLTDNLNAVDAVQKVVSFTFDGLFSRDVQ